MDTEYPWDGKIRLQIDPSSKTKLSVRLRIPGFVSGEVVPGDLYVFEDKTREPYKILLNGKTMPSVVDGGYAVVTREWKKGDVLELNLPMTIKRVVARNELEQDVDRVALQRGPIVYCVEGADNDGQAWNLILPDNTSFETSFQKDLLGGVQTIAFNAPTLQVGSDGKSVTTEMRKITAIPYYAWCNRGQNAMQVWLPRKIKDLKVNY
jgi:uncharacterized protein